uniref:Uncharacterized protein n=1 Tax=Sphaerodactylus townsendi TaxID=933632 RepID=A0ACB8G8M9_9SAUR
MRPSSTFRSSFHFFCTAFSQSAPLSNLPFPRRLLLPSHKSLNVQPACHVSLCLLSEWGAVHEDTFWVGLQWKSQILVLQHLKDQPDFQGVSFPESSESI